MNHLSGSLCVAGCKVYFGGEIYHHKDCPIKQIVSQHEFNPENFNEFMKIAWGHGKDESKIMNDKENIDKYDSTKLKLNRFQELICVIFGHDWAESGSSKDQETGIVLSQYKQCGNCGIRIVDESGYLKFHMY